MFQSADVNNDGLMDEEESISLIRTLSDGVRQGSTDRPVRNFVGPTLDFLNFLGPGQSWSQISITGPIGIGPWIPGVRDNVIKNKLHEYLRNKKADNTNAENGSDGLTIEEFIELFKDVATRPEVYFTLGMFRMNFGNFRVILVKIFYPANGT